LTKEEFLEAIAPQEPYSKMLVRDRAKRRGPRKQVEKTPTKKNSLVKSISQVKIMQSTK